MLFLLSTAIAPLERDEKHLAVALIPGPAQDPGDQCT